MKTSILPLFSMPLQLALVISVCPLAAGTVRAENPFKVIGAKAKQGFSKVTKAVHPRRIGAAIKNAALAAAPEVRVRPVRPATSYQTIPDGSYSPEATAYRFTTYASQSQSGTSEATVRYLSQDPDSSIAPTGYYTGSQYRLAPATGSSRTSSSTPAHRGMGPPPLSANATDPVPAPDQPINSSGTPSNITPGTSSPTPDPLKQHAAGYAPPVLPKPIRPAFPREDLPFGELVPGKTGYVHSPYSKTDLVDVSGIPTGTKVKCPYTGKTFRVP